MTPNDWVIDKHGNVGRVVAVGHYCDDYAVQVVWSALIDGQIRSPWVKQKYLTVVTKEVADIARCV